MSTTRKLRIVAVFVIAGLVAPVLATVFVVVSTLVDPARSPSFFTVTLIQFTYVTWFFVWAAMGQTQVVQAAIWVMTVLSNAMLYAVAGMPFALAWKLSIWWRIALSLTVFLTIAFSLPAVYHVP